ncbi:MAG: hypothetical protein RIA69_09285 [Cyclobacteriaceae bacterium]
MTINKIRKLILIQFFLISTIPLLAQSEKEDTFVITYQKGKTETIAKPGGGFLLNVNKKKSTKYIAAGVVRYSQFGAIGDGKIDDIVAIAATHVYANEHNLRVEADAKASYYIGGKELIVNIQTSTDFKNATFILDDTNVENFKAAVFRVTSKLPAFSPEGITSLVKNQQQIPVSLGKPHLITLTNDQIKRYKRRGLNENSGHDQTDIFAVDKDGVIDPKTPIIWDFDQISEITAFPIDTVTLTLTGGKFLSIANQAESKYTYYARNIEISRSNVIIDSLEHRITGEGDQGAPYRGFISVSYCSNVLIKNTNLTGHKTYKTIGNAGKPVSMGSYDINLNHAINVTFENCHQLNDIYTGKFWGIMGTNFCKNITLDGCTFSRFDAHMGVTNAAILNSSIGYMGIRAIGHGTFTIENTTVKAKHFVFFRQDYGSSWEGEFIIKNCVFIPIRKELTTTSLIHGANDGQHDFGYTCSLPNSFVIENMEIRDQDMNDSYEGPLLFSDFNPEKIDPSYLEKFPYQLPEKVMLKNVNALSGKDLKISENPFLFKDVKIIND